jgi:hypothetical protein
MRIGFVAPELRSEYEGEKFEFEKMYVLLDVLTRNVNV